jgi:hypothetical protein
MKHRNLLRLALLVMATSLAACAGGRAGMTVFQRDVGNASGNDAVSRALVVIGRNHFEVAQQDSTPFIRIETHWRSRTPFRDEQALGVTSAESRVIIIARPRAESEFATTYNVRLMMENRVRVAGGAEWNETLSTPEFRQFADKMAEELRREYVNIGVRAY